MRSPLGSSVAALSSSVPETFSSASQSGFNVMPRMLMWSVSTYDSFFLRRTLEALAAQGDDIMAIVTPDQFILQNAEFGVALPSEHFDIFLCNGVSRVVVDAAQSRRLVQQWGRSCAISLSHMAHEERMSYSVVHHRTLTNVAAGIVFLQAVSDEVDPNVEDMTTQGSDTSSDDESEYL